jgi:hypothetical protein
VKPKLSAGAKRVEVMLQPEAAAVLAALRKRTGSMYSAIIEGALLAAAGRAARGVD